MLGAVFWLANPLVDIIHGDIKPGNVLAYKDGSGFYAARITDFGYSTCFANEDDIIYMPQSWPWHAPEHHYRGFKGVNARRMDIFSFGMVALWIMFERYISGVETLPVEVQWARKYFEDRTQEVEKCVLDGLKQGGQLVEFGQQLVLAETGLDEATKIRLSGFFGASLAHEPELRDDALLSTE
jgi:hypothetical protein